MGLMMFVFVPRKGWKSAHTLGKVNMYEVLMQ
jgi:hypothetical protein